MTLPIQLRLLTAVWLVYGVVSIPGTLAIALRLREVSHTSVFAHFIGLRLAGVACPLLAAAALWRLRLDLACLVLALLAGAWLLLNPLVFLTLGGNLPYFGQGVLSVLTLIVTLAYFNRRPATGEGG